MHTPGPWTTGTNRPGRVFSTMAGAGFVASCCQFADDESAPNRREAANARLIAAAPQLLEALRFTEEAAAFIAALLAGGPTLKQVYLAHDELLGLRNIARDAIEAAS